MNANLLSRVPSWLILVGSLAFLALTAYYLVGRAPLVSAPRDYDDLRKRYEPIARLTTTSLIVGTALGIILGLRLDPKGDSIHFGIAAGTGSVTALCCLWVSMQASSERSWAQFRHYQDMCRGKYALPASADLWLLVGLVAWGIIELWAIVRGT